MTQEELYIKLKNAAHDGDLDKVKEALEQGADIHTERGFALALATHSGHIKVVRFLIEKGSYPLRVSKKELKWAKHNPAFYQSQCLIEAAFTYNITKEISV